MGTRDPSVAEAHHSVKGHRGDAALEVSVVVCAYTERRWDQTCAAIRSVFDQQPKPAQVLVVIDHNPALAQRARGRFPRAVVLENEGAPGLSGARNTGLRAAAAPVTVFLDDDAEARPGWLASLVGPYSRRDAVATGGSIHPRWPGARPPWAPPAFDWVFGCSYLGLPDSVSPVRNPIGANMSLLTHLALEAGGFDASVGRVNGTPRGGEETELAIRLTTSKPGSAVYYVPDAAVDHHVGQDRITFRYFIRRCWHEGRSKATLVKLTRSSSGLKSERRHIAAVIPATLLRDLRHCAAGDLTALMRMSATIAGMAAAVTGYVTGRAFLR
ncbi:MAG: glycosyltransferase [Alphaproteobacteria bacterium]|nr:glycosyltransferase [Alphaproteobacteria bacterium]MBV9206563.1 glycosyltransferase [Actinomycetota bacterium]